MVLDGNISVNFTEHCDGGGDESIASPRLSEKPVLRRVEKITEIEPASMCVALKNSDDAQQFFLLVEMGWS